MAVVNETVAANMPTAVVAGPMATPVPANMPAAVVATPMPATMSSAMSSSPGDGRGTEEEQQHGGKTPKRRPRLMTDNRRIE